LNPNKITKFVDTVQVVEYFGEKIIVAKPNVKAEEGSTAL